MTNSTSGIGGLSVADPSQNSSSPKFSIPDDFATTAATIDGLAINSFVDPPPFSAYLPLPPNSSDFPLVGLVDHSQAPIEMNGMEGIASSSHLTVSATASTKKPRIKDEIKERNRIAAVKSREKKENELKQMEALVSNLKSENSILKEENQALKRRISELESKVGSAAQPIFTNLASSANPGLEKLGQSSNSRSTIGYEDQYGFFPFFGTHTQPLLPNPTDRSLWESDNQASYSASTLLPSMSRQVKESFNLSHLTDLNGDLKPMTSNAEFSSATVTEQPISSVRLPSSMSLFSNLLPSSETGNGIDGVGHPQNGFSVSSNQGLIASELQFSRPNSTIQPVLNLGNQPHFSLLSSPAVQNQPFGTVSSPNHPNFNPEIESQQERIIADGEEPQQFTNEESEMGTKKRGNKRSREAREKSQEALKESIDYFEKRNAELENKIDEIYINLPPILHNEQISQIISHKNDKLNPLPKYIKFRDKKQKKIKDMTKDELKVYNKNSQKNREKKFNEYAKNLIDRNSLLKKMIDDLTKIHKTFVLRISEQAGARSESENQQ